MCRGPSGQFLSLFQLLKYFPGPLEPVATQLLPGLADRVSRAAAIPRSAPRAAALGEGPTPVHDRDGRGRAAVVALTALGLQDRPAGKRADDWGLLPIAGLELATGEHSACKRCHVPGGPAAPLDATGLRHDEEWLLNHMIDPVAIAPGVRTVDNRRPRTSWAASGRRRWLRTCGEPTPASSRPRSMPSIRLAALTYASTCVVCHRISGEGGKVGPDLTSVGERRDAAGIRAVIEDATAALGESSMPTFRDKLSPAQIDGAGVLSARAGSGALGRIPCRGAALLLQIDHFRHLGCHFGVVVP